MVSLFLIEWQLLYGFLIDIKPTVESWNECFLFFFKRNQFSIEIVHIVRLLGHTRNAFLFFPHKYHLGLQLLREIFVQKIGLFSVTT